MKRLWAKILVLSCLLAVFGGLSAATAEEWGHRKDGGYYRVVDLDGKFITETALDIGKGDIYISEANERYIIDHFDGDTAYARAAGKEKMPVVSSKPRGMAAIWQWAAQVGRGAKGGSSKTVGIYHTHSAESYKPTSGVESETPRGDIYEVGRTLARTLEQQGYRVQHSDDVFLPHDGEAYMRSRRVAAQMSQNRPQTIIDVHRDAIPDPNSYRATVNGQSVSQVRLVVGRQNQNREANLEYAKRIKAIADEKYPGLIKGIFHARGNYNQDLGPRMILLEFGTHTTTLDEAKRSAELMANVIPAAAGMAAGTEGSASQQIGGAAMRTVWWILGLGLIGTLAWLFINKEGRSRWFGRGDAQAGGALGAREDDAPDTPHDAGAAGALGSHRKRRYRRFGRRRG